MRKTRPSTEDRVAWLWNTLNLTIETFDGVTEDEFKRDWGLWMKAHGCLIAVGQDLHRNLNVVDKELESYYRKLRNDLGHDHMLTPPDVLWEGIQNCPKCGRALNITSRGTLSKTTSGGSSRPSSVRGLRTLAR